MYGAGATYDSIEGRFRIIKREAAVLKAEVESGARQEAPQRGSASSTNTTSIIDEMNAHDIVSRAQITTPKYSRTPKTPVKKENVVLTGRVTKPVNKTPTKQRNTGGVENVANGVKAEVVSSGSSMTEEGMLSSFGTQDMRMEDWVMSGGGNARRGMDNDDPFGGMMMGSSADVHGGSYGMV
ncbi:hypothetical protein MMC08_007046 [Hypocenomyce scalaris]|nr:hypothetical protein [Hypocenomyce scalaris]